MIQTLFLFLFSLLTGYIVDFPSAMLVAVAFFVGKFILVIFDKTDRKETLKIYGVLYLFGLGYLLMCYAYMTTKNLPWLMAYDSYNVYIPWTETYYNRGEGNLMKIYSLIFEDFSLFATKEYLYYAYCSTWGMFSKSYGGSLYFTLQVSTLYIYPFVGVLLFKLCGQYGIEYEKRQNCSLIICLISIVFFYSSLILRDIHVLLCYLIAFYLTGKQVFSVKILLKLVFVICVTWLLRLESGIFLLLLLPIYLILTIQKSSSSKQGLKMLIIVTLFMTFGILVLSNFQSLLFVFNDSRTLSAGIEEEAGAIGLFQRIPIVGGFISIFYNASLPIPCWSKLDPTIKAQYAGLATNIMTFPRVFSSFFNVFTYTYFLTWLFSKPIREKVSIHICKPMKWQLWLGLVFLYLQSAVISQRRLMPYYCIYYLFMFIIANNISKEDRRNINIIACGVFLILQIIGLLMV